MCAHVCKQSVRCLLCSAHVRRSFCMCAQVLFALFARFRCCWCAFCPFPFRCCVPACVRMGLFDLCVLCMFTCVLHSYIQCVHCQKSIVIDVRCPVWRSAKRCRTYGVWVEHWLMATSVCERLDPYRCSSEQLGNRNQFLLDLDRQLHNWGQFFFSRANNENCDCDHILRQSLPVQTIRSIYRATVCSIVC